MRITIAIALTACGGAPLPATPVAKTTAVAVAPSPAPPPPVAQMPVETPLATCTDGGNFEGAWIGTAGIRYCIDKDCWSFDPKANTLAPVANVAKQADDDVVIAPFDYEHPTPITSPWTAKHENDSDQVEVCGPDGCAPFPVAHTKYTPDRGEDEIESADVSASGERVAVMRGAEGIAKMNVEIYDRKSHKRLGIARPTMPCARLMGFAGDSAVVQEWDCANQGGPRMIIGPSGKLVARVAGNFSHRDEFVRVDGDRWAFTGRGDGTVSIYDVVRGSHGTHVLSQFATIGVSGGNVYGFEGSGRVTILSSAAAVIATAAPPTCRWQWEAETVGKVRLDMTGPELRKVLGAPRSTSKPDDDKKVTVTYGQGLAIHIQTYVASADPCGGGPAVAQPAKVIAIDVVAPSKVTTGAGIAIGSTVAELETAYGSHRLAKRSSATVQVFGNDGETGGWSFEIADGKVAAIHLAGN
jgi:hypothetical protein